MKKLLLVLLVCLVAQQVDAQDPDVFQDWFLYELFGELPSNEHLIRNIEPPIQPTMTILPSLEFMGVGACNTFSGIMSYDTTDDSFSVISYTRTNVDCGHPEHVAFELEYLGYLEPPNVFYYYVEDGTNGEQLFSLQTPFFSGMNFGNIELGVEDLNKFSISINPNPVSETLFVTSEGRPIQSISVYSITGERVLSEIATTNQIDVSGLKAGLYFAEIATSEGKSMQKFIKK